MKNAKWVLVLALWGFGYYCADFKFEPYSVGFLFGTLGAAALEFGGKNG